MGDTHEGAGGASRDLDDGDVGDAVASAVDDVGAESRSADAARASRVAGACCNTGGGSTSSLPPQVRDSGSVSNQARSITSRSWNWQAMALFAYGLVAGALLLRLAIGTLRARRLMRRSALTEGRLTSGACATPVTVGWLRPVVILPGTWQRWSAARLDAVLAHEQAHVRRRDPLVQWLALLNRAIFWFHPLAWWLERRLSALAEQACDEAVLAAATTRRRTWSI